MKSRQHSNADQSSRFPSTHWSSIALVAQEDKGGSRDALSHFVQRYVPILRAYLIRWRGLKHDEADDCIQGFLADRIIERDLLAKADPAKGRLRSFLMVSLDNYLRTRMVHERQLRKRHERLAMGASNTVHNDPAVVFNIEWARWVLKDSLEQMKRECEASGRLDLWTIFQERVVLPAQDGRPPMRYEVLVRQLELKNPICASNLLITAKRSFTRVLRNTINEYITDTGEIEMELADLRAAFAQATPGIIEGIDKLLIT